MVEENNTAARALYVQAGYRQVGVAQNYYGRGRSGLWMQKRRGGGEAGRREGGEDRGARQRPVKVGLCLARKAAVAAR
jgi:hypothetical protein